jgi:hypothetical protein
MSAQEEKQQLFAGMDERRENNKASIADVSLDAVVHPDSGWMVKDLLGHLATWEWIATESVKAHLNGEKFRVDFGASADEFNNREREKHAHKSGEELYQMWEDQRQALKDVIASIPDDRWGETFKTLFSRGEAITAAQVAKGMGMHEALHIKEIVALKEGE